MENKKKILIVDDDKFLLSMYAMKFEKSGFQPETAPNGSEALEKLKEGFKPDILLMDIIMPVMDGFAMFETVLKDKLAPNAVFIMLTNQGLLADINRAKALGVHGYIVKATTIPSEVVDEVIDIYKKNKK